MERGWIEKIYTDIIIDKFSNNDTGRPTQKQIRKLLKESFPAFADITEKEVKKQSKQVLKERRNDMRNFKRNLIARWGQAFDLLEIFITYNLDQGVILAASFRKNNQKNIKFETILRIHARSCQIAFEIIELLKGGFADGALARWRSLYELSVFVSFLKDKPEILSQRFLDYSFVERHSERLEFQKNCKRLGYKPLTAKQMLLSEKQMDSLKAKYGNDFSKPYGWAAPYLLPGQRTFKGMEETIAFSQMRSFYKLANNYVHGGSRGFLFKLGMYKEETVMLAGPSNYGLADPGQQTAKSLLIITSALCGFENYLEDALFLRIANNLMNELSIKFENIQKDIIAEERLLLRNEGSKITRSRNNKKAPEKKMDLDNLNN